jgi:hypothetical protein
MLLSWGTSLHSGMELVMRPSIARIARGIYGEKHTFVIDLGWRPLKWSDDNSDGVIGCDIGSNQQRIRHGYPVIGIGKSNGRKRVISADNNIGCGLAAAILDPDIGVVCLTDNGFLVSSASIGRNSIPDILTTPMVRLILVFAGSSVIDVHIH